MVSSGVARIYLVADLTGFVSEALSSGLWIAGYLLGLILRIKEG